MSYVPILVHAIEAAHAAGMRVMLRLHVDSWDGTWRGEIAPNDTGVWFEAYRGFVAFHANLAADAGVDLLSIGSEMRSMTGPGFTESWKGVIASARSGYSGPVTYVANCAQREDEYRQVAFWGDLDLIALSTYVSLLDPQDQPTLANAINGWSASAIGEDMLGAIRSWALTRGQPVIIGETGYQARRYCLSTPWWTDGVYDESEQMTGYEAFYATWEPERDWLDGVFWWGWVVPAQPSWDNHFSPRDRQAETILCDRTGGD